MDSEKSRGESQPPAGDGFMDRNIGRAGLGNQGRKVCGPLALATITSCPERGEAAERRSVDLASANNADLNDFIVGADCKSLDQLQA
jgi:hypothetical protein